MKMSVQLRVHWWLALVKRDSNVEWSVMGVDCHDCPSPLCTKGLLRGDSNVKRHPRLQSSWGQHGAHLGPVGPRCAPCWPHETCYEGCHGSSPSCFNTLRPRQNGRHFRDDIIKCIFLNESIWISIEISLKFVVPKGPIKNIPALVEIMAWCRTGDKPLSEPMLVCLLTHICVIRPQWVNETHGYGPFCRLHAAWHISPDGPSILVWAIY